jgi:hypothetical protein
LTCGPSAFASSVDRLSKERKELAKDLKLASEELSELFGRALAVSTTASSLPLIYHHRPHTNLAFLSAAAEAALCVHPDALVVLTGDDLPPPPAAKKPGALPPPDPRRQSGASVDGPFVVYANDAALVSRATAALLPAIGGRGGGRATKYQGQASNVLAARGAMESL